MGDLTFNGGNIGIGYCKMADESLPVEERCVSYKTIRCNTCWVQGKPLNFTNEPIDLEDYGGKQNF